MLDSLDLTLTLAQENAPPPPSAAVAPAAPGTPGTPGALGAPGAAGDATTQAPAGAPPGAAPTSRPPGLFDGGFFFVLMAILVLMFVFSIRSQSKEKKKRQALIDAIKKGDTVQTIGGILGTVAEVRDKVVIVKVDENANVKLRFAKSAIQSVVETKDSE